MILEIAAVTLGVLALVGVFVLIDHCIVRLS